MEEYNGINLEPRLAEYIKRKRYYKQNDVYPAIPLEKTYGISESDKQIIRKFLKGKTQKKTDRIYTDFIDPRNSKFESAKFKDDPRYERIQNKLQRERDAQKSRNNFDIMHRNYDMYRKDRNIATISNDQMDCDVPITTNTVTREYRRNIPNHGRGMVNRVTGNNFLLDSHEFDASNPYEVKPQQRRMMYNNPPKVQRGRIGQNNNLNNTNNVRRIIGELDTYRQELSHDYERGSDMDLDSRMVIPNINSNNKRGLGENRYNTVPYMAGNDIRNVDIENYIKYGVPSRGAKSLGYANPAEHYFDYIDGEIQDPDHTVFEYGIPTRLDNKRTARVGSLYNSRTNIDEIDFD